METDQRGKMRIIYVKLPLDCRLESAGPWSATKDRKAT